MSRMKTPWISIVFFALFFFAVFLAGNVLGWVQQRSDLNAKYECVAWQWQRVDDHLERVFCLTFMRREGK